MKSVTGGPGRPATDPQVLLALWMLATVDGVGSARRLARLCEEHNGYRWLRWNVPVNHHMLSDFRVANRSGLENLLTQVVATLMSVGAVTLRRVAQDGMRVRASAGASSFRGKKGLKRSLKEARMQVERLARERDHSEPEVTNLERAARERAAREREERVRKALELLPLAQQKKERQRHTKSKTQREKVTRPRVSTTDPQARVMKMPDGGFRPAYNVELATDGDHGVIVGVGVTNAGTDAGQAVPMEKQVEERTGLRPHSYLMDGGFANREDITILEQRGVKVYAPVSCPGTSQNGICHGTEMARRWFGGVVAWPPRRPKPFTEAGAPLLVDQRPNPLAWRKPVQRAGPCQSHHRNAPRRPDSQLLEMAVPWDLRRLQSDQLGRPSGYQSASMAQNSPSVQTSRRPPPLGPLPQPLPLLPLLPPHALQLPKSSRWDYDLGIN